jgi:short-subunit dehydrogenase
VADTALITGASGGIGEELARMLAAGGADVVLVARSADKLAALAAELAREYSVKAVVIAQDLSARDAADRIDAELAARGIAIDILVNNAGFATHGPFVETPAAEDARLLQVNVVALTMLTKKLLPAMVRRGRGRLLNVASTAAFQPGPLMAVYYASKAYVLSFSEALTSETSGTGVTVTCLCPGPTETGFQDRAGMRQSKLFSSLSVMSARDVAAAGYDGMMAGRALVIPGFSNKLGAQITRVMPRAVVRRVVRRLHEKATPDS